MTDAILETLDDVKREVARLDAPCEPESDEFKAAVCLMSCAIVRPGVKSVCGFTGYPRSFVEELGRNWRRNRVWCGKRNPQVHHSGWFDQDAGGIAFWLDVSIGLGWIDRVST